MANRYVISSVQKSLRVLKAFKSAQDRWTLTELSEKLDLNKSNVLRILVTLESEGLLVCDSGRYSLGLWFDSIAATMGYSDLKVQLTPYLETAAERSGMIVHFTALVQNRLTVLLQLFPSKVPVLALASSEGGPIPLHATGAGKVIAAFEKPEVVKTLVDGCDFTRYSDRTIVTKTRFGKELEKVRAQGYAVNDREHEVYLCCLTRPVFFADGSLAGAFSLSGFREMFTGDKFNEIQKISEETQRELCQKLGYTGERE